MQLSPLQYSVLWILAALVSLEYSVLSHLRESSEYCSDYTSLCCELETLSKHYTEVSTEITALGHLACIVSSISSVFGGSFRERVKPGLLSHLSWLKKFSFALFSYISLWFYNFYSSSLFQSIVLIFFFDWGQSYFMLVVGSSDMFHQWL